MSDTSPTRSVASEFVGTALLMIGGPGLLVLGGPEVSATTVALGIGISAAIAIGVIGAVANPMFSLALWFARAITRRELFGDLFGQFAGAFFGAAALFALNDTTGLVRGTNGWEPNDDLAASVGRGIHVSGFSHLGVVLAAELLVGVLLVVVLLAAVAQQASNAAVAAFVGGAYAVATLVLMPVSGAGLNPAKSVAMAAFADTTPNALAQVWPFVVVPLVAAFAGLLVWLAVDDATIDDTVFDDSILESAADAAGLTDR